MSYEIGTMGPGNITKMDVVEQQCAVDLEQQPCDPMIQPDYNTYNALELTNAIDQVAVDIVNLRIQLQSKIHNLGLLRMSFDDRCAELKSRTSINELAWS